MLLNALRTVWLEATLAIILRTTDARPSEGSWKYATILERQEDIKESYDYIIVGAGTAGLTVADRLTEDPDTTVLVIEYCHLISDAVTQAGGGRNFSDPGIRYNITSVPQPEMNGRTQGVFIGCCVGGSSAINGMVFVRGTSDEYDGWAELGGPDSTWNWEGILPYFRKASHFTPPKEDLAKDFNITWDPEAWAVGDGNSSFIYATFPEYQNPSIIPMYKAMAKMPNMDIPLDGAGGKSGLFWFPTSMDPNKFWRSYARTAHYDGKIDERPNFEVITRHKVRKIVFAEGTTTATGVEFFSRDSPQAVMTVKANREVIISAGTVHTPQILQLSGVGPTELLAGAGIKQLVDLPGVGQNFQDHAYLRVGYQWGNGAPPAPAPSSNGNSSTVAGPNLGAWIPLSTISDDWEAIADRYEAQDPAEFLPAGTHPDVIAGYSKFQALHAKLLRSRNVDLLWLPITGSPGGIVMSMHVVSHGTINIDPASPESEPIVDYRALSNPIDMDIMVENIRFMRKFMGSKDFAQYEPIETSPGTNVDGDELKEWIRTVIIPTNFHPIATAAKKPREDGGVVDEMLMVHGTQNLRVVDGSIMPTLPGANTQQSVYMIAEKASDMIKQRAADGLEPGRAWT